jgi:hypothetical protein
LFLIVLVVGFCGFCVVIKVVICLFGEKVKENQQEVVSRSSSDAGRGKERGQRGENRFFLFIKIMGWEAIVLPNKKTQN